MIKIVPHIEIYVPTAFTPNNDGLNDYLHPTLMGIKAVSYTHLRAHETVLDLVCRLLLEKKKHKF